MQIAPLLGLRGPPLQGGRPPLEQCSIFLAPARNSTAQGRRKCFLFCPTAGHAVIEPVIAKFYNMKYEMSCRIFLFYQILQHPLLSRILSGIKLPPMLYFRRLFHNITARLTSRRTYFPALLFCASRS